MTDKNPSPSSLKEEEFLLKFDYLEKRIIELENTLMEFMAPSNNDDSNHYKIYEQFRRMVDDVWFELNCSRDMIRRSSAQTNELVARITELEEKSK